MRVGRPVPSSEPHRLPPLFQDTEPEGAAFASSNYVTAKAVHEGFGEESKNDRLRAQVAEDGWHSTRSPGQPARPEHGDARSSAVEWRYTQ
jgi:hypothetical protein